MYRETISEGLKIDYNEIGNKAKNLLKLKEIENKEIFEIPEFICLGEDYLKEEIEQVKKIFKGKKVAVRSSSNLEDGENNSFAGAFETFLNIDIEEIEEYIKKIHKHSLTKFGIKIPIIIQEMVENIKNAGVVFTYDIDENKPYYIINHHEGIGEELVGGEKNGEIIKIINNIDENKIKDIFIRKLISSVKYVSNKLGDKHIDVEFAYDGNKIKLLQVRPITTVKKDVKEIDLLSSRYASYISNIIKNNGEVLGDMIDINPEELVGNKSILTKTFFSYIFPQTSLKNSRDYLGYGIGDNFREFILNKMYINLEKNLVSFLPNSLTKEEIQLFVNYYKKEINNKPTLQSELDSRAYPINLEVVSRVLDDIEIDKEIGKKIIEKFSMFFLQLEEKLQIFYKNYTNLEKEILLELGVNNFLELLKLDLSGKSIDFILNKILYITYQFSIHARGAFYYDNIQESSHVFYQNKIYKNILIDNLIDNNERKIDFNISDGFDFFSQINSTFELSNMDNNKHSLIDENFKNPNELDVFLVARDNLKFILMILIREFGDKIEKKLDENNISKESVYGADFITLIDFIKGNKDINELNKSIEKSIKKKEIMNNLILSPIINDENNLEQIYYNFSNGYFMGKNSIEGEIIYIDDIKTIKKDDIFGKILVIENATPEIDNYLDGIKGIITKNGGPLAHIAIRARELGIPAVVGIGDLFKKIKLSKKINIDFGNKTLDCI